MQNLILFVTLTMILSHLTDSLKITHTPPLLDVPTYSLATLGPDGKTGMNILTYASPVSVKPNRVWAIGLFKGTVAHENFSKRKSGILQLLPMTHSKLVRLLGGESGRDVNKEEECLNLGFPWISLYPKDIISDDELSDVDGRSNVISIFENLDMPMILPGCVCYMVLSLQGDLIDCGSHDVAICRVDSMIVNDNEYENDIKKETTSSTNLNTATLRDLGIITEQGRVAK